MASFSGVLERPHWILGISWPYWELFQKILTGWTLGGEVVISHDMSSSKATSLSLQLLVTERTPSSFLINHRDIPLSLSISKLVLRRIQWVYKKINWYSLRHDSTRL